LMLKFIVMFEYHQCEVLYEMIMEKRIGTLN